ncbi:NAD(P)-dependent dehydrogenase, short-chain alcohol dehydrogenase family [Halopseudomonas sabulinigri]|uniref:NAD(P)-dependent dehydrogenase, short-chain alcohol dehydrogenase family n=1 Tax=Halopseudomonas sabulinigri TaxID=472181 RepID=A0A1H1N3Q9_9GAMM|nr:SDR family oxidoreductase [Halopseudomonas sabulinigri]SDR92799.1 NAD(P)-dependent dehydrogenase, short-chain alcohol dehydrogenase family [Halopseudomonas sabulinigri]
MSLDFAGKVVLVTGAAAGIGKATAEAFAAAGARLILADVDSQGGEAVAAGIRATGGDAVFQACNVVDAAEVKALIDMIEANYGRLDCAYNNAGIEIEQDKIADAKEDVFDRIMDVNVKGVWQCMRFEIPLMLKNGGGAIVNTGSIASLGAAPKMSIYAASKHAVLGLTRSAAVEYGKKGIRVNAVCPAVIDTDMFRRAAAIEPRKAEYVAGMHPVGRIGKAEEIAAAVLYLCSDAAAFTTGIALPVDGGSTCI